MCVCAHVNYNEESSYPYFYLNACVSQTPQPQFETQKTVSKSDNPNPYYDITSVNFSDFTNLLKSHIRYDTTVITGCVVLFRPLTCKIGKGVKNNNNKADGIWHKQYSPIILCCSSCIPRLWIHLSPPPGFASAAVAVRPPTTKVRGQRSAVFSREQARQRALYPRVEKIEVSMHGPGLEGTLLVMNRGMSTPLSCARREWKAACDSCDCVKRKWLGI